jgi:DNA-directed RNA polymerase specialized sigma24 family protein
MIRFKKRHIVLNLYDYEQYSMNEEEYYILEQILSLPLKYKTVQLLYYVEGYKINEIAKILKITQSAVKRNCIVEEKY